MSDPTFGHVTPENLPLFTDRYELSMMQGYVKTGHDPQATFSLFFRELPPDRGYLLAAGLEQVVCYLEGLTFSDRAIEHLAEEEFGDEFLDYLADFEFTGDLRAVPEGTPVFPDEPLIEVTAPIAQAQLFETLLINQVGFQSLAATKAARMRDVIVRAGDDQSLVDFGSRRAHGTDAGMKAARGAYVGGFDGTSNEAAAEAFGVPAHGTMAHSWVQSFPTEREAFDAYLDLYGEETILLVDTYDTIEGTKLAGDVAEGRGIDLAGVRLDSGDPVSLSKEAAGIVGDASIFVSSGVDEYRIESFLEEGGVADGFGPGTALTTSGDARALDIVYKLVAVERAGHLEPSMKLSTGKVSYPGRKSVRRVEGGGRYTHDVVGLADEDGAGHEVLVDVYDEGELVYDLPSLREIRERSRREVPRLPDDVREIDEPATYPVEVSDALERTANELRETLSHPSGG